MIHYEGAGAIYVAIIVPGVMADFSPIVRPIATTIVATLDVITDGRCHAISLT